MRSRAASGLDAGAALSALTRLELAGLVSADGAGRYERSATRDARRPVAVDATAVRTAPAGWA